MIVVENRTPAYTVEHLPDGRIKASIGIETATYFGCEKAEAFVVCSLQLDACREINRFYSPIDQSFSIIGWPIDWSTVEPPQFTEPQKPIVIPAPQVHVHVDRPRGIGWFR
jgi:hypothetical protein